MSRLFPLSLRLASCAVLLAAVLPGAPEPAGARSLLRGLPLRFEPNAGQWNPQVRFAARTPDATLLLTARETQVALHRTGAVVGIALEGSRGAVFEPFEPLAARSNYFVGSRSRWRAGVANYGRVRARGVYPGIDVVYYGNAGQLEYDFVLSPGADPNRIRMRFRGPGTLAVTGGGDLVIASRGARFLQKRPRVFQDGREVRGRYRLLARNVAGFELERYDRTRPLTIDPVLSYSTLVGGSGLDAVTSVKFGPDGMVYATGYITTTDSPTLGGPFQDALAGGTDVFVAKLDPTASGDASLVYFTYIGGKGDDAAYDMAVDSQGAVYLTGSTGSTDFPTAGLAHQLQLSAEGTTDAFMLKLDPSRPGADALVYSTYLGGTETDEGRGIAVYGNGLVYFVGTTKSENFPITPNALSKGKWGVQDAFVAKIDIPNATLAYSTYLGGETWDEGRSVAVTPTGEVYVTGNTLSQMFQYTADAFSPNPIGGMDIFVTRLDFSRSGDDSLAYSTCFGGSGLDQVTRIAVDPQGRLLLTGLTASRDFPVTGDAAQSSGNTAGKGFAMRLNPAAPRDAQLVYATYLGGSGGDVGEGIAGDAAGNIWVTGYTLSRDFPTAGGPFQATWGGGINAFVAKLAPGAGLAYASYAGATGIHVGNSIAVALDGSVAVGGLTGPRNIGSTDGALRRNYAGGLSDGFVLVLKP
ncbi:MAG: SBBP repeat-containing protein [Bryobacteraceae bacterium]